MKNMRRSLHNTVHHWMDTVGFRLNFSKPIKHKNLVFDHYFYKTFDFVEQRDPYDEDASEFLCFDSYGEKVKVRSLLDLQHAFFENLSQVK